MTDDPTSLPTLRYPGDVITIGRIDPYGLTGREQHPPIVPNPKQPTPGGQGIALVSPLDGEEGEVIRYIGWFADDGMSQQTHDPYRAGPINYPPSDVFDAAREYHAEDAVHLYLVRFGRAEYEIAEYEIAQ